MKKYVLVLDVGTTNIKAFLFDKKGKIAGETKEQPPYIIGQKGEVEQDPDKIWEMSKKVLTEVLKVKRLKAENIVSLGITTQRSSFLLWDKKTGKKQTNIITWQDKRCAHYAEKKTNLLWLRAVRGFARTFRGIVPSKKLLLMSILKFDTVHASSRTGYLFKHNPELKARAHEPDTSLCWGTIDSWILWNLTGGKVHATDYSNASATGILDPFTLQWNSLIQGIFHIPDQILPEIRNTRGDFGSTSLFGGGEIPISAVIADQQSSLYGQCCFEYGDIKCTNGTGSFIDLNTGSKPFASKRRLYPLVAWRVKNQTTYMLEGQSQNTGSVIDWLQKELKLFRNATDTEKLAMDVDSNHGIFFLPAFTTGLTFPYWDATATGNVFGISLDTTKAHIVRAVLEGICYRIKDIVDGIVGDTKIKIKKMKVDGGVSKNRFICQFLSDILGIDVEYYPHPEPTALGAAFMAGLASGYWKSEDEIGALMKHGEIFTPRLDEETRQKKYARWKDVIQRSLQWCNTIDK
jgi:putative glycerol kinase 5